MRFPLRTLAVVLGLQAVALFGVAPAARALPPPAPPRGQPSGSPAPATVPQAVLPYGSPLLFVLDDKVSSRTTPAGATIRMHLKSALVVNGVTIAPAGTAGTFTVVSTSKAQSGDVDGAIAIHVDPLVLPGRTFALPIRAYHEYLTVEMSGGQLATRSTTDTLGDIFIPYHMLYHALRPGHQMLLPVGSVLRAETEAAIDARNPGAVLFPTPPPFASTYDTPHADLTPAPFYTPGPERPHPLPKGKPTLPPTPQPSPSAAASGAAPGAPGASASPVATTSPIPSNSPLPPATPLPSATPLPPPPASPRPSASSLPTARPLPSASPAPIAPR